MDHNTRRYSMPVQQVKSKQLASFAEDENEFLTDTNHPDRQSSQQPQPSEAQSPAGSWVVLKPDTSDRPGKVEQNLRRWSLRTSAILSAHPKLL